MDLVCVGDVMLDVHVASGALARGGDVHGRVAIRPGGTSANAAVWAAWAGASAAVIAAVGDDLAGALCVGAVADHGVDVGGVVRRSSPTGVMVVMTEDGERSMVADRGANAQLGTADVEGIEAGAGPRGDRGGRADGRGRRVRWGPAVFARAGANARGGARPRLPRGRARGREPFDLAGGDRRVTFLLSDEVAMAIAAGRAVVGLE